MRAIARSLDVDLSRAAVVVAVLGVVYVAAVTATYAGDVDPAAVRSQVQAHIQAGEFAAALKAAEQVSDPAARSRLIRMVVDAQVQAGAYDAALATSRWIGDRQQQMEVRRQIVSRRSLAGGYTNADFQSLIDLIENETSGPWEDIDGYGGTIDQFEQGVHVDPNQMLSVILREERSRRLRDLGIVARRADLNEDVARPSPLRLVSLRRLEHAVAARLADGKPVVETMKRMAGLYRVEYVFVFPEQGDVVIGGPAEGWEYTESGDALAVNVHWPTLCLDDFVTVYRVFCRDNARAFGCSINPRREGLQRVKQFVELSRAGGPLAAGAGVRRWVRQIQRLLGMQDIEVYGIPENSRVARIIVAADYRMKLIGIDKLDGGPGIPSIFDLLTPAEQRAGRIDALRWWLTMKYDALLHSPDRSVYQIQGSSVLCRSENQFISDQGKQVPTGKSEGTNRLFAQNFTEHYEELARRDPVFAELQNVFDLSLVAALLHKEKVADRIGWDGGVFAPGGAYRPATYPVPKTIQSVVNYRVYHGRYVVVQVAGGVRADVASVIRDPSIMKSVRRLADLKPAIRVADLPEGRWWWDARLPQH